MINLDSSLQLHGLTLFRDYNRDNVYAFLGGTPRLRREGGEELFELLIYREDVAELPQLNAGDRDGGGFLTMTVDLGVPESTLEAVRRELESRTGGPVDLVPLPLERSSVRVSALGETSGAAADEEDAIGSGFVEEILASGPSSNIGDNTAVISMELTKRGALLMRASVEDGGASQIAVIYEIEYKGLMPARECKITINFKQSYQHLRTRATLNTLWFKADIDAEMERLVKEGHITIEDVDYLGLEPGALAQRATELQNLAKELGTWAFFRPGLQPGKVIAEDRGQLEVFDPTAGAVSDTTGFTSSLTTAATGQGDTGDTAGPRLPGRSATATRTRVGGEAPPTGGPSGGGGETGAGGGANGNGREPTAVERWNRAGRPQAGFLMRSLSQEEQQTITFDLRQVSAQTRPAAPQSSIRFASGSADLARRIKLVDLNEPFFDILSGSVTSTADFAAAGVRSMTVKIRYGERPDGTGPKDTKEFPLTASGQSGTFQFHLDHRLSVELEYQVVVRYAAGFAIGDDAAEATSEWIRTSTRNLDVDPRIVGGTFTVTLAAGQVDWGAVQSIQAEVRYRDQRGGIDDTAAHVLTQANATAVVPILPKAGGPRDYEVAATFFYADTREGPVVQQGRDLGLVVLNQPPTKAVPISATLLDPLGRIRKGVVELLYQSDGRPEQQGTLELTGDGAAASWTLFRSRLDEQVRYRHRITLFRQDGTTQRGDFTETTERQLLVGDVIEGLLEVEVRIFSQNLATDGIVLAKVRLEYPDAPDWADADIEKTVEGVPAPFNWRVPRKPGGGKAYHYRVDWFRADGTITTVGPETVSDETLIIIPPRG